MNKAATETLSVVVERELAAPPEKVWRALTQPHLIEEWLMKNDFKPAVGHRFNLSGEWGGVLEQDAVLHVGLRACGRGLQSQERGDLDAHANGHGYPFAHGAVGLPAGPEAGLWRRQGRVVAVPCEAGTDSGAGGLKMSRPFRGSLRYEMSRKERAPCRIENQPAEASDLRRQGQPPARPRRPRMAIPLPG